MQIVHISDWHGRLIELPPADLYVSTGDMLPNFPLWKQDSGLRYRSIDPTIERCMQGEWLAEKRHPHRSILGNPDAPIVCVRGNHDFIAAADMFPGCDVRELVANEVIEVLGLRITGHRGIPLIWGVWSDETTRPRLTEAVQAMEVADLYVTHYPPADVLDFDDEGGGWGGEKKTIHYGLQGMSEFLIDRHAGDQAWHLFGHIHECGGGIERRGTVTFSNAATTFNVITIER